MADRLVGVSMTAAQFTERERDRLSKSGAAMPDGGFPIRNRADLRNAIRALGRAKNRTAAKRHIIARARKLGATDQLPEGWGVTASVEMGLDDVDADWGALVAASPEEKAKIEKVMKEFAAGTLKSSGKVVTDKKQALAIAFSEARKLTAAGDEQEPLSAALTQEQVDEQYGPEWRIVAEDDEGCTIENSETGDLMEIDYDEETDEPAEEPETGDEDGLYASAEEALTAAAAGLAPVQPPKAWFDKPKLDGPTPITVTADGRIFGHAALWGTCHTGMSGTCRTPPRTQSDYAYFHLGEIDTAEGEPVHVGRISMNTGHAPLTASRDATVRHYDDTGTGAAHVRAYEDEHGIVLAGAVMPDLKAEDARRLRGAPVSGDWRSIGGKLEMVGMLAVNVPGFPVPRAMAASLIVEDEPHMMAMVAAGMYMDPQSENRKLRALTARAKGIDGLYAAAMGGTDSERRMGVTAAGRPFDPTKHPRVPGGSPEGGRWARVTYPDGTVEYKEGLASQVVKDLREENPGVPIGTGQPGSIKVAPIDKPPEADKRVREGGAAKVGDTVEFQRHGGVYHARVMSLGPMNAKVTYKTKNHKVKTISVPHREYKVVG